MPDADGDGETDGLGEPETDVVGDPAGAGVDAGVGLVVLSEPSPPLPEDGAGAPSDAVGV